MYNIQLNSLIVEKVMLRKDLESLYHGLGYEEVFGPEEMSLSYHRKKSIDNCAIVIEVSRTERKEIFGEDGVLGFFLTCVLVLVDKMDSFHKLYVIATSQRVNTGPPVGASTLPPTTLVASYAIKATLAASGFDKLIRVVAVMIVEDLPRAYIIPLKRDWGQSHSPLFEEDSRKLTHISRGIVS